MASKAEKATTVPLASSSYPVPSGSEAVRQTNGQRWLDMTVGVRPDPKAVEAIEAFAKAHNLLVTREDPASARIELAGTAEDINAAFDVTLFDYSHPNLSDFYAPTGPLHIDAKMGGAITGVNFINDPITPSQVEILRGLLGDQWSDEARNGFLVISGRFVDDMGIDRTEELAELFRTESATGRLALRRSLEALLDFVGSLQKYESDYRVLVNDPEYGSLPALPQLPILGIEELTPSLYRAMDSKTMVYGTNEPIRDFISREGKLPYLPPPERLVLRAKPKIHWCSYTRYDSPSATSSALQILPEYHNDCTLRATLPTKGLDCSVFVAFNGDTTYPDPHPNESMAFVGYYVEVKTQDHPEDDEGGLFPGGGIQVGVFGSPRVLALEEWDDSENGWTTIWSDPAST